MEDLHPIDQEIANRLDNLYYCNMFYMTFTPLEEQIEHPALRFIHKNHIVVKEGMDDSIQKILPGHGH